MKLEKNSKIYIAGHNGLVGSAILRKLKEKQHTNLIYFNHNELDLTDKNATETMFRLYKPEFVFLSAAKVGGIHGNSTKPGDYFYDNIMIQTNVMESARKYGVKKLLFLGSSCIYPKEAKQPIKEEYLLTGPLETTNKAYATAKIAGIEMCNSYRQQYGSNFISVMPCNLYGIGDNFSLMSSHVLPAFIRKFHDAKLNKNPQVEVWGDGTPLREFMCTDDVADALYFLMQNYNYSGHINVGTGYDVSINDLAEIIKDIVGYKGNIVWNKEYPNGTMKKLMDNSRIKSMGWEPKISLEDGLKETYKWFNDNYNNIRK